MAANMYSRLFHQLYALPITTAGIYMVYGPGQHDLTKLVPYSILSMLRNQTLKLSGGTRLADWVYVEDVVDALITIARSEKSAAQTLDVGTGVQTSVRGVVEMIQTIIGGDTTLAFGAVAERPNVQQPKADTETTFEKIGWQARTPLCEGLENTVIWHRERLSEFDQTSSARLTTGGQSRN